MRRRAPNWLDEYRLEEAAARSAVKKLQDDHESRRKRGRGATGKVGGDVATHVARRMLQHLNSDLKKAGGRGGGSLHDLKKELVPGSREEACQEAARAALNHLSKPVTLNALALGIADAVEDVVKWRHWAVEIGGGATRQARRYHRARTKGQHAKVRKYVLERDELIAPRRAAWKPTDKLSIGGHFIAYLTREGLIDLAPVRRQGGACLSDKALRLFAGSLARIASQQARAHPLIIPPVDWNDIHGGGFHFNGVFSDLQELPSGLRPLPLVRSSPHQPDNSRREALLSSDLSLVHAGLNALQRTPWRVNVKVLRVLNTLSRRGQPLPGGGTVEPTIPDYLTDDEAIDPEKKSLRIAERAAAFADRDAARSRSIAEKRALGVARQYARYATRSPIYFAYNTDFRGRVYPCSPDLSPHGADLQRGLLEFFEGERLTRRGADWLKVRLANCWGQGEDKRTFEDRRSWTDAHLTDIRKSARSPYKNTFWHSADDPIQFLAACFAWVEYEADPKSNCRAPIYLDASCSGLQHWAALLRDEKTARAVNLLKTDDGPRDLYGEVAEEVKRLLEQSPEKWAAHWLRWGIDRKIVKKPVMVLPYGAAPWSRPGLILEAVSDRLRKKAVKPFWSNNKEQWKAARLLSDIVGQVLDRSIARPVAGMKWTKEVVAALKATKPAGPILWVAPSGFPVVSNYRKSGNSQPIRPRSAAWPTAIPTLRHYPQSDDYNWKKASNATAPNFVHSLDASHLVRSLARAAKEGLRSLAAVHDAFATSPNKTDKLRRILGEEFAWLYTSGDASLSLLSELAPSVQPFALANEFDPADIARSPYLFS